VSIQGQGMKIIEVYDLNGKLVYSEQTNDMIVEMNLSSLNPGMYMMDVNLNGSVVTKKLNIQ
ncbi:MAG: T9SS type A sorting domain-containing protein, partial [Bacteroidota bacterium]